MINYKTLNELYMIPSYKTEEGIDNVIKRELTAMGYEIAEENGNIYAVHPRSLSSACLSAHKDMVKTGNDINRTIQAEHLVFGVDNEGHLTSLGADDKNGIFVALTVANEMKDKDKPKLVFFTKEETGLVGSSKINTSFFETVDYCIVSDRKNGNEIIMEAGCGAYSSLLGLLFKHCNPEFVFGKGSASDCNNIRKYCDTINISSGYYNAHTENEYTNLTELEHIIKSVKRFLTYEKNDGISNELWSIVKEKHKFYIGEQVNEIFYKR